MGFSDGVPQNGHGRIVATVRRTVARRRFTASVAREIRRGVTHGDQIGRADIRHEALAPGQGRLAFEANMHFGVLGEIHYALPIKICWA